MDVCCDSGQLFETRGALPLMTVTRAPEVPKSRPMNSSRPAAATAGSLLRSVCRLCAAWFGLHAAAGVAVPLAAPLGAASMGGCC
jgi:hypothetical protein